MLVGNTILVSSCHLPVVARSCCCCSNNAAGMSMAITVLIMATAIMTTSYHLTITIIIMAHPTAYS